MLQNLVGKRNEYGGKHVADLYFLDLEQTESDRHDKQAPDGGHL